MQAVVAATSHAAQCLGMEADVGSIEVGKKADLILVDGDPLEDVTILEKGKSVALVMKGGEVHTDLRREING